MQTNENIPKHKGLTYEAHHPAIILTMPLFAEHILFDFENEADAKQWKQHSNAYHAMDWTDMYATSGKKALRYTAKNLPGMPE